MNKITPVLFQTNKTKIEDYIIDRIKLKLGNDWKYEYYSDDDIIQFFKDNPIHELPHIITKFNALPTGSHKANLFRYYYLFIHGGFFLNSDAMIMENIENIVKDYDFVSVDSTSHPGSIFHGILGSSPRNEIIKKALYSAYQTDPILLQADYHYWCKDLYNIIKQDTFGYSIKLYKEQRLDNGENGDDIMDNETNQLLFKHYWKDKIIPPLKNTDYTVEFTNIYNTNYWIDGSGSGSTIENTKLYNKTIVDFIRQNNITQITDIGCGDWQSSFLIYQEFQQIDYLGIDCVKSVIENNKLNHPQYNFITLDILCNIDLIRDCELYIIKDVLQHWKLKDIYDFLDQLIEKNFKYIIITNRGNQGVDNLELDSYIGDCRGLDCQFLPLKKYNAQPILDYYGDENKHICRIQKNYTTWNHYNKNELHEFDYRILTTFQTNYSLIRLGPPEDGGYVIADGLEYDLFISVGIANDIRFEESFLDMNNVKCFAFDGTISSFPAHRNPMEWIQKNIDSVNTDKTTNLKEYLEKGQRIFLKMDIEGSEFNWLDSMTTKDLQRCSQIVLEVHWPFDIYRMNQLKKLKETHYIIHLHGNNNGQIITIQPSFLKEIQLPEVFEITYINKNLVEDPKKIEIEFPTRLDFPNNPNAKDISFSIPLDYSFKLIHKKYSWGQHSVTFLENGKMDAFGVGYYYSLSEKCFYANFESREHTLVFNENYTEFLSIRKGDYDIVRGNLLTH